MLVQQVNGQWGVPLGVVVAPCHHVADDLHLGVLGADGLVELVVTLVVVVALLAWVGLVVLVAHLQVFQAERLGVSVLGAHRTIFRCDGAVGILYGVETLVNPGLDAVVRRHAAVPQSDVHHEQRFGTQVLCQLQVLMVTQSVRGAVTPVHVPVALTLLDWSDGSFPTEGVVGTLLSLHEATSRETHELRVHLPKHVGEIGTHAVLSVLEGGREEADHVELHLSHAIEDESELRLRVVVVDGECGLILRPSFGFGRKTAHRALGINTVAVLRAERRFQGPLVLQRLGPKRQAVTTSLHGVDAPVTLIHQAYGHRG